MAIAQDRIAIMDAAENASNARRKTMWPSFETAVRIFDVANFFLIGALAVGVVATVLVVWMGKVKEYYQDQELAATRLRSDEARQRAAEAEARAAEAKLELMKLKAPRALSREQQQRLITKLRSYPGTKFEMVANSDEEAIAFANSIGAALLEAGWAIVKVPGAGILGSGTGIYLYTNANWPIDVQRAAESLISELKAEGIRGIKENKLNDPDSGPAGRVIRIYVLSKPEVGE